MPEDLLAYLIVCPLVFVAGFVDAIAGGGGLISLPAYLISGLPVHIALGTNKLSSMAGTALTTYRYAKLGYIQIKSAIFCIVAAFAGSSLGASLAMMINDRTFKFILLFILPLTAIILIKRRNLSPKGINKHSELFTLSLCSCISLVVGIYDGFYGPGTGTFLMIGFLFIANFAITQANGLTKAVNLATNIAALAVFLFHGTVLLKLGICAGVFSIAGNFAGSKFFEKYKEVGTKPIMIGVMLILILKLSYEIFW